MLQKEFTTTLQKSPGKGGWTYVIWPEAAEVLGTHGSVKVRARADGYQFDSSVMPMGNGVQMLPIKAGVRKIIRKEAGDTVSIGILERL